ncbi:MAG: glutamine--tRNA ligase/YqeY domain fusion protein [Clostridia bacterium]|nr:glutamine--tRNA ligase/YqeY domain fusion protein [Clostridia bacterium]
MDREEKSNFIHDIIDKDLAEGRLDHVHTRFPPEPNGYLHIGSAKAIWINFHAAKSYNGLFNLRYDDTNPEKEDDEFVQAIYNDLCWLGAKPTGGVFYGSDYFEECYRFAEKLIMDGVAYVCELTPEQMSEYRGAPTAPGKESPWRNRPAEESLEIFRKMRAGEFKPGERTLRAKIDMTSPNMNMRDPVLYRIVDKPHHRQGSQWKIYPMYDFAHPIQDALEGITHSCCSIEFANHRPLYDWVIDHVGFEEKPHQYEFARLNMTYTVMSKRYLRKLVETGAVDGWDDPRMPTLCGLRRRGYTPSAIFDFIERSGVSKAESMADARLLEFCITEELGETAPRRVAVLDPIKVTITNYPADKNETFDLPNHPQKPEWGTRAMSFSNEIYIDREDFMKEPVPGFKRLLPGGEVRLMGAYILKCTGVEEDENGKVIGLTGTVDLETGNGKPVDGRKVKGTIHWLSKDNAFSAEVREYNYLFNKENVATLLEDDHFEEFLATDSMIIHKEALLEKSLQDEKPEARFQFVRTGYFTPDSKNPGVWNRIVPLKSSYKGDNK